MRRPTAGGPRSAAVSATPSSHRLLVVDDEPDLRTLYELTLVREGYEVDTADTVDEALGRLRAGAYSAVITDMRLPDGSGLDVLHWLESNARGEKAVVITAYGSAENAVEALKAGAFDYLTKPVDLRQFRTVVASALGLGAAPPAAVATPAARAAGGTPTAPAAGLRRLVGRSTAMQQVRSLIEKVARSMAPVLVQGESGTGKELVARAIHDVSPRAGRPFIAVNCGAIPEALLEAEFFGYRKGAFTGADRDRDGFFHAAAGGTLFLDEVAELPLAMQVKLLRAIQERRVRKVGATAEEPVDVRILSATHQDLSKLVAAGRFRQDLYYRLNVIELHVPSLRERADDIPLLAEAILARLAARGSEARATLSTAAIQALKRHPFPGNVRELENVLERAVALAGGGELQPLDLMLPQAEVDLLLEPDGDPAVDALVTESAAASEEPGYEMSDGVPSHLPAYLDALERQAIRAALLKTRHNRTAAAQLLGITFRQLRYRMQRLGLK